MHVGSKRNQRNTKRHPRMLLPDKIGQIDPDLKREITNEYLLTGGIIHVYPLQPSPFEKKARKQRLFREKINQRTPPKET